MKARKGEWFSLDWDIIDFADPVSYEQYDLCPRFIYAEDDSGQIESEIINKFNRLRLVSIHLTIVFITNNEGIKFPTHYIQDKFMPGDRPSYDAWLNKYHNSNFKIAQSIKDKEIISQKNIYLEHAAKIIRHDMHSGINTYIPRGYKSLVRRMPEHIVKEYRLGSSLKLLSEGIEHAQRVYGGVYAFTNLVKENSVLEKEEVDLFNILVDYISGTAYSDQVVIEDLPTKSVNPSLFCTAINNFVKNGLKYNDSDTKFVKIYMESKDIICIEDNGRGLSKDEFLLYSKPYIRKENQKEPGSGLGLNIANSILKEHGFSICCEKISTGTIIRINLDENANKQHTISG